MKSPPSPNPSQSDSLRRTTYTIMVKPPLLNALRPCKSSNACAPALVFRVFILIHKMDLVLEENREAVFINRKDVISDVSGGVDLTFFMTSIWDETLYKASGKHFFFG